MSAVATATGTRGALASVRIPPFALAAALAVWGWQTGFWPWAILMAAVLEGARWAPWRWDLDDRDFNRLCDVTAVGFIVVAIYGFDRHAFHGIYALLRWMPFVFFFLTATALFSTRNRLKYSAVFYSVRRAVAKGRTGDDRTLDITLPYFVICLVSATGGQLRGPFLMPALVLVVGWVLWHNRPESIRARGWVLALLLAVGVAYLAQFAIIKVRRIIEPAVIGWFQDRVWSWRDPYRAYTAMGHIGRLKLSDRIELRVHPQPGAPVPTLLKEASYQTFSKNIWLAGNASFKELTPDIEGTTWKLVEGREPAPRVRVSKYLRRGRGLLAVPAGTFRVERLPVESLQANPLGALKIVEGPGLVTYDAIYEPTAEREMPPDDSDLFIPEHLSPVFASLATELDFASGAPRDAVRALARYFEDDFSYAVTLTRPTRSGTPIEDFLLRSKRGHCEFFASATVLALRAAGIPSRYATGYAVQEWSELEQSFVVRRRHGHAWALAWIDGRWHEVDNTPPAWGPMESEQAPWWEGLYDLGSWIAYQFSRWRWSEEDAEEGLGFVWLVAPLMLILAWRLYFSERVTTKGDAREDGSDDPRIGEDSAFYAIAALLDERGLGRAASEPMRPWLERVRDTAGLAEADWLIRELLPLHYRYRFDPGVESDVHQRLLEGVGRWMGEHAASVEAEPR